MESKSQVELPYKELVTTLKLSELTKFYYKYNIIYLMY